MGPHDQLPYWSALAAAVVSGCVLVFAVVRGPRNALAGLYTAILAAVFEWNLGEWLHMHLGDPALLALTGIGFTVLPVLFLHFAVLVSSDVHVPRFGVAAAYAGTAVMLVPPVGGLFVGGLRAMYDSLAWNATLIALAAPMLGIALARLVRTWHSSPPARRGFVGLLLAAGVVGGSLGVLELAIPVVLPVVSLPKLANLGGAVASVLLATCVIRHRDVFDGMTRLRTSTASLLDAMNCGVVTFDHAGSAVFCNARAEQLLGGRPGTVDDLDPAVRPLFQDGGTCRIGRGGLMLRAAVVPVTASVRQGCESHLVVEDVTREHALLREAAQREGLAALGQAAATIAHEIRNGMTEVRAGALASANGAPGEPNAALRSGMQRLDDVVGRALELAHPLEPDLVDCDVGGLLRAMAARAPGTPEWRLDVEPGLPAVRADPDLVAQVVANLVRNAAEAGAREVRVAARRRSGAVEIVVANRGPPIPEHVLARLFVPFVTTKARGTGIGLALCRKIVAAHGGEIGIRNVEDGVECCVSLPSTR